MSINPPPQPSQIPALVPAPAGWTYNGCYEDTRARILEGGYRNAQDMTVMSCISICNGNGFGVAGVQSGTQCFCANAIKVGAVRKTETECGMGCAGDASQRCGDFWRLNVYQAQSRVVAPGSGSSSSTFTDTSTPTDTSPPQAPAPIATPLPSTPSSIAIASTNSPAPTGAQPSFRHRRNSNRVNRYNRNHRNPPFSNNAKMEKKEEIEASYTPATTPTCYDIHRDTLPSYDDVLDLERNDEGTDTARSSPVMRGVANSKASLQPRRDSSFKLNLGTPPPRTSTPTTDDSRES
ncbi:hypothetical protein CVT24_008932 [Panaeolus cyanescens]|uniref:WSC domain-containing protein n=1 Tax=Panaeolus cyanescens TaxID=181874 RepID=A0A409WEE4_9AGAR|nr:hypothetical protein CVT24_008932 [Panaeolus cyanescens]